MLDFSSGSSRIQPKGKTAIPIDTCRHVTKKQCRTEYQYENSCMLMSRNDSNFERSNISFKESKLEGDDLGFNSLNYCTRKNEIKILRFSSGWNKEYVYSSPTLANKSFFRTCLLHDTLFK